MSPIIVIAGALVLILVLWLFWPRPMRRRPGMRVVCPWCGKAVPLEELEQVMTEEGLMDVCACGWQFHAVALANKSEQEKQTWLTRQLRYR